MKYIKTPFQLLWRLWFYLLVITTLILLFPVFLILTAKKSYYPNFWKVLRGWSFFLIYAMGFRLKVEREEELDRYKSYMFCPNHASLMDGFVLIALSKNPIVLVGKKELSKMPLFGYFYKKAVIMVDRNDPESRKKVYQQAKERLKNGTSIAIFPEGLVPEESVVLAPFKNGAFNLAIQNQIPIVPHIYYDCKRLFSWDFFKGRPGTFRVKQCHFIKTAGLSMEDKDILRDKTFSLIYKELTEDTSYMKDTNNAINA